MMILRRLALMACVLALAGCASNATRLNNDTPPFADASSQVQSVHLNLSTNVRGELWYNESIKPGRVLAAMKRNLHERGMLGKPSDRHLPSLEILITDIRARSPGAAQWLGPLAGEDRIVGDVIVRDASGKELERINVKSTYAWGAFAATDAARMAYLADAFAERAAEQLTGRSLSHAQREKIASKF